MLENWNIGFRPSTLKVYTTTGQLFEFLTAITLKMESILWKPIILIFHHSMTRVIDPALNIGGFLIED